MRGLASCAVLLSLVTACGATPTPDESPTGTLTPEGGRPPTATPASAAPTAVLSAALTPTATPTSRATATQTPPPRNTPTATTTPARVEYIVQPNDTLGGIAQQFGISAEALMQANNLSNANLLRTGQSLVIPLPTPTAPPPPAATRDPALPTFTPTPTAVMYIVQSGDTLSSIAVRYQLPVDDIMAANGLKDPLIRAGQSLVIPPPTPTPTITPTPLPTVTATPKLAFGAPSLLYPPNGAVMSGDDAPVLNWLAVGALSADQYYVLRLRGVEETERSESVWLKTPSYRLLSGWRGVLIEWDVIVVQVTRTNPDGSRDSTIQSPFSRARQFLWR